MDLEIPDDLAALLPEDFTLVLEGPEIERQRVSRSRAAKQTDGTVFQFQYRGEKKEAVLSAQVGDDTVVLLKTQKMGDLSRPLNWSKGLASFLKTNAEET